MFIFSIEHSILRDLTACVLPIVTNGSSNSCALIVSDYISECETVFVPDVSMTNRGLILSCLLLLQALSADVYFSMCPCRDAPVCPRFYLPAAQTLPSLGIKLCLELVSHRRVAMFIYRWLLALIPVFLTLQLKHIK